MREQIDFLILAPLDEEIKALIISIKNAGGVLNKEGGTANYYRFSLSNWNIVVFKLEGQGCLQSLFQTMRLLDWFDPEFIVSFGIAGTLREEVKLGDVVIGRTVYYYEPAKETIIGNEQYDSRQSGKHTSNVGRSGSASQHLPFDCHEPHYECESRSFDVHDKQFIASGEKLIADINSYSRQLILLIQRKMACAEMEAAGVAAAVKNHRQQYERNKFMAVKGISDYADKDKNSGTSEAGGEVGRQEVAAANAATILIGLIQKMTREVQSYQANQSRIDSAKQFAGTFNKWLGKFSNGICSCTVDYNLLKRAAFYAELPARYRHFESKIPIYYHWRQLNANGLHLVDYLQLILLHKLSKSSCVEPIALITHDGFNLDELEAISSQVKKIIGSEPIFSSEIRKEYKEYTIYCANNGYDGEELDVVSDLPHVRGESGKRTLLKLLPYVAYNSRHAGACIVLCWDESRKIYDELLMKILPLQPIIMEAGTIKIGNERAKIDSCGKELIINPSSNYEEFSAWVRQQPDNKMEVLRYINCLLEDDLHEGIDKELFALTQLIKSEPIYHT